MRALLEKAVAEGVERGPVLSALGQIDTLVQVRPLAARHYAEIRTFMDLKLPSRMRLCPSDEMSAKRFFWKVYAEEQGEFEQGKDHAEVFARFCCAIGISREVLEKEYGCYWPRYSNLLTEPPSHLAVVRELAISYAWESMAPRISGLIVQMLDNLASQTDIDLAGDSGTTEYFREHISVDVQHGALALETLLTVIRGDEDLKFAARTIRRSLVEESPWSDLSLV